MRELVLLRSDPAGGPEYTVMESWPLAAPGRSSGADDVSPLPQANSSGATEPAAAKRVDSSGATEPAAAQRVDSSGASELVDSSIAS